MAYSTIPKGSLYMNTKLYTGNGNGSGQAITGVGFQPDWAWIKNRTDAESHSLTDIVRGVSKGLLSNSADAETTDNSNGYLSSFNSDGFTTANAGVYNNANAKNYVSWNWKANGQGSSNTDGSINTTYTSANTTSGVSIVSYTGTGSNATVGHGLGVVPEMIIVKRRNGTQSWRVGMDTIGWDNVLYLDTTNASGSAATSFNSTAPTNQFFYVGTDTGTNGSGDPHIAYCFASVKGFSQISKYFGNGSTDGTFVYTGFKPSFVMVKKTNSTNNWVMTDNKRNPFNVAANCLFANLSDAEGVGLNFDLLSNGFKLRSNSGGTNSSGDGYSYLAFAENPFVATSGTSAIPVTAR